MSNPTKKDRLIKKLWYPGSTLTRADFRTRTIAQLEELMRTQPDRWVGKPTKPSGDYNAHNEGGHGYTGNTGGPLKKEIVMGPCLCGDPYCPRCFPGAQHPEEEDEQTQSLEREAEYNDQLARDLEQEAAAAEEYWKQEAAREDDDDREDDERMLEMERRCRDLDESMGISRDPEDY